MIPSGKVYQHDRVMIYDQVRENYIAKYFNTGDMMVYDSTLKLLDFEALDVLAISDPKPEQIERYNRDFDYVFLRASNFIHEHMNWEKAVWVLEQLKIPVYALGVGAQAETKRDITLSDESRKVWQLIAERSPAIGVRGAYSAEVLNANGIKNVEVIGCPSLFRTRNRDLKLRLKPADEVRRIAFSLRRETSSYYAADMASFVKLQKELLLKLSRAFDTLITIHGEPEEKSFFVNYAEGKRKAVEYFVRTGWFDQETRPELQKLYERNLFLNDRVEDYDTMIAGRDFGIGYRVHGVLPALAQGTPATLVDYDTRSGELAETFSIPHAKDTEFLSRSFDELFDPSQFDQFTARFPQNYDRFKSLMDRCGIPNLM